MARFRLYPTKDQESLMLGYCATARYVWNLALEQRLMWRRWQGPTPNVSEQMRQLTEARAANPWLAEGSATVQQQALRDHEQAWRNYFAGTHGKPTWRRENRSDGFRMVGLPALRVTHLNKTWSQVDIQKIGAVRFRRSRPMNPWKSYRVTRDRAGRWYIAFTEIPASIPAPGTGEVIGVDLGVAVAATLSNGEMSSPAGLRPKEEERLRRMRRRQSKARPGSKRQEVARLAAARISNRRADRRKDWTEKTSTDLARRFDLIRVEDLNVMQMTAHGKTSRALNRRIRAVAWGELVTRLEQKAPGRVEKVDPRYTSQRCNACGHIARGNRKSQAAFSCQSCGHKSNADVNAAKNIADREPAVGRTVAARRDLGVTQSAKREPRLPSAGGIPSQRAAEDVNFQYADLAARDARE